MGDALQLAGQWGPMGLLVAYLIYQDQARARQRTADKQARLTAEQVSAAERTAIEKETNEERRALTSALTALTMVIQQRGHA